MSVYFMANIRIDDPAEYEKYLAGCDEVFARHGGRYLAVDGDPAVLEGSWPYSRAVLVSFPDEAEFRHWYNSTEYQAILKHRLAAAQCDTVLIRGNS